MTKYRIETPLADLTLDSLNKFIASFKAG